MLSNTHIKIANFSTVDVPDTGILILAANDRRIYATIVNASDTDIWIKFGSQNADEEGIFIASGGFSYEIDHSNLWRGAIYAIHGGSGTKKVSIFEGQ